MNVHEQIEKLVDELAELKRQVEREKKRFKEGDWVVCRSHEIGTQALIKYSDDEFQTGFNYGGDWSSGVYPYFERSDYTHRLATKEEIETAPRREWDRRCKKAGWENGKEAEIDAHANESITSPINSKRYTPSYYYPDDRLWTSNGLVYQNGKWATPKPKQTYLFNQPDWFVEVDEHEVHIGCQSYTKEFIKTMIDALEYVPAYTPTEIIKELKRIKL